MSKPANVPSSNFDNTETTKANSFRFKSTSVAELKFPGCDAAVQKIGGGEWDLADAIVAECSETGDDGVRNESHALMEAMRQEIARNHGIELSFERVRKLRKVASAFPPGRRRPGVSVEGHLEARTPDALDELVKAVPAGTGLTRDYIRQQKYPALKAKQDQQKNERSRQIQDQQRALQGVCRQLERERDRLVSEKEARELQYAELCRSVGKEPEPLSPPLAPQDGPPLTVAEDLEQALRSLLVARRLDSEADNIKKAIANFVNAVVAQAQ